jgi:hypothetical protein
MTLCAFKNLYKKVIEAFFPSLKVVDGTHLAAEEKMPMFKGDVKEMLATTSPCMKELAEKYQAMATQTR